MAIIRIEALKLMALLTPFVWLSLVLPLIVQAESNADNSEVLTRDSFEEGFGTWSNVALGDNRDWTHITGRTPSGGTGSETGGNGSQSYVYVESSDGGAYYAGDSAIIESAVFAASRNITMQFQYHMYGSTMGTLAVDVLSNGAWVNDVWSLSGQQQTASQSAYNMVDVDLSAYAISQIRFRTTAIGNFQGDIALDNVIIRNTLIPPTAPEFTSNPIVKVEAVPDQPYNSSLADDVVDENVDPLTFSKVSGPAWLVVAANGAVSGTPTVADLGDNSVVVSVSDGIFSDTTTLHITVGNIVTLFNDDFEEGFGTWSNVTSGDNRDWTHGTGRTPSGGTGPEAGSNGSQSYVYVETSSGGSYNAGDSAIIESAVFAESRNATLQFQYHMYGSNIGALAVDVLSSGAWMNDVWSLSGQQQTTSESAYSIVDVDLRAHAITKIRFRTTAVGNFKGDIALDNIKINHTNNDASDDGLGDNLGLHPNNLNGNWTRCANEGGRCFVPMPTFVRYGIAGQYYYKQVTAESIACNSHAFGYPVNAAKHCDYVLSSDSDFDGDGVVDSQDVYPVDPTESVDSDGDGIGNNADPAPNDANNIPDHAAWLFCSDEWENCEAPAKAIVRYGANNTYIYKVVNDEISCTNSVFSDPTPGVLKNCDYLIVATPPYAPEINDFPESTANDSVVVSVSGLAGTIVWVNGINTDKVIPLAGNVDVVLDTTGSDGKKLFTVLLKSILGQESAPLNISITKDTTAPNAPTLTELPTATIEDTIAVEVNGEVGAKVFVNGVDSGEVVTSSGKVLIALDTSGDHGSKPFSITLKDSLENTSESLSFVIDRQPPSVPVITNFKKQGWFDVGAENSLLVSTGGFPSLSIDSNNISYVAYRDKSSGEVFVKRFNGLVWEAVGIESLGQGHVSSIRMDSNNVPYVSYREIAFGKSTAFVKRFNGVVWETVGTEAVSAGIVTGVSMHIDSNNVPYVAYTLYGVLGATVKRFNGDTWEAVGEEFSQSTSKTISMSLDNNDTPYVLYFDTNSLESTVKAFNGTSWEIVGEESPFGYHQQMSPIIFDSKNIPHVISRGGYTFVTVRFNGTSWDVIKEERRSTFSGNINMSFDGNDLPYIAYTNSNTIASVKRFNGSSWETVGEGEFLSNDAFGATITIDNNNAPYVISRSNDHRITVNKYYDGSIYHNMLKPQAIAIDINASNIYDSALHYSLLNSHDASLFTINENNGVVTFLTTPDFENPHDSNQDNTYVFEVKVVNEYGGTTIQKVNILVLDSKPRLSITPTKTFLDKEVVEVNGQPNDRVFVNGVDTGKVVNTDGVISIELNTSGENGDKIFSLTLVDELGNQSNVLHINILKGVKKPILTNTPKVTTLDTIIVEVNGEPNNKVLVNGVYAGIVIASDGKVSVNLDTAGADGNKVFALALVDESGNQSNTLNITIVKDTTGPNAPTLTIMPIETFEDSIVVEINGEVGSQIFVNGAGSRGTVRPDGKVSIALDTSGDDGDKLFSIKLKDSLLNVSESLSFVVNKQTLFTPTITNFAKKQEWLDVGLSGSSLAVGSDTSISVDNNNIPYIIYKDATRPHKVTVKRFVYGVWEIVGADGLSTDAVYSYHSISLDRNNVPYVSYVKTTENNTKAIVQRFNGEAWEDVGTEALSASAATATHASISFDNNNVPYVAYKSVEHQGKAIVKRFNGVTWGFVGGESISQGEVFNVSMSFDNNIPYVAYTDVVNSNKGVVKKLKGAFWETVGDPQSVGGAHSFSIIVDSNGVPYTVYRDIGIFYNPIITRFNGTAWERIGGEGFPYDGSNVSISIDSSNTLHLLSKDYPSSDIKRFNGVAWEILGEKPFAEDSALGLSMSLDSNDVPYVIYTYPGSEIVTVKRLHGGSITNSVFDREVAVIDIDATDIYNGILQYALLDSYDASLFSINEHDGTVMFITAPDVESPHDGNKNNTYAFEVKVTNEKGGEAIQKVNVSVLRNDKPSLTTTPTTTTEDTIVVEVNGNEQGERVFVNGVDTLITLSADKKAIITLDTSGEDGYKYSEVKLRKEGVDYFSTPLVLSIYKDNSAPELLSGWPATNEVVGLNQANQLELIYTFFDKSGISSIKIYDHEGNDISESATIDSNSIVLNLAPQEDRSYDYTIVAADRAGNKKEAALSFNIKHHAPVTIASLPSGLYGEPINVDLISSAEATIYYSTDGYPPMVGAENTQQGVGEIKNITISSTTNLQYFSIDVAGNREKINSAVYRFNEVEDYNTVITTSYDENNQQISLSWDNSVDAKEYKVYRVASKLDVDVLNNSKDKKYLAPAVYFLGDSIINSFADDAVSNGASYYYAVSKVDQNGIETLISELVKVTAEPIDPATDIHDSITRAKNWLYSAQNNNGSLGSTERLKLLATTSALDALHSFKDENKYVINKALMYVFGAYADNNDYLSRQILTLSNYDLYTDDKVNKLLSQSYFNDNSIYGWGLLKRYHISPFDTALAYKAIKTSGQDLQKNVWAEINLQSNKRLINPQGYWGWLNKGATSIYVSALIYGVSDPDRYDYSWINQSQNIDGSFGDGLLDTIGVVLYLQLSQEQRNNAFSYIISQQSVMGDFNNDVYLSALVLQALLQGVK
ncbi:PKD domain containing protein [gamma proteobacterium IMCC1989]|nr:PKD domain containing protein [gamma proteobacterium IMCC1989]